jgi:hypothetical protein
MSCLAISLPKTRYNSPFNTFERTLPKSPLLLPVSTISRRKIYWKKHGKKKNKSSNSLYNIIVKTKPSIKINMLLWYNMWWTRLRIEGKVLQSRCYSVVLYSYVNQLGKMLLRRNNSKFSYEILPNFIRLKQSRLRAIESIYIPKSISASSLRKISS